MTSILHDQSAIADAGKLQSHFASSPTSDLANDDGTCPLISQSIAAYRRELPDLLNGHYGEWVAYRGDVRLGFGASKTELYQQCFAKGLKRGEFFVECIEPELPRVAELPLNI